MIAQLAGQRIYSSKDAPKRKLQFSPYVWGKLEFIRAIGCTPVAGYGVSKKGDPLFVVDFHLVRQTCSAGFATIERRALRYLNRRSSRSCVERPVPHRIWIQTAPSQLRIETEDLQSTFDTKFPRSDWAVYCCFAGSEHSFAMLKSFRGPGVQETLRPSVSYAFPFRGSDEDGWKQEYDGNVTSIDPFAAEASRPESRFDHIEQCASSEWVAS